jgi:hypothetical protein
VISFLLGLNHVPIGEAVQAFGFEVVGKLQIQIGRIEFLIDLVVQKLMNLFVHTCLRLLHVCLPQAVEIAVCVYRYGSLIGKCEGNNGIGAGLQALSLTAAVGLQIYPRDVVLLSHGMGHGTDGYLYGIALTGYNGNVLFVAGFHHTGLQLGHLLTAAHHRYTCVVDHAHHIAAMLTYIEFVLTHNTILQNEFYLIFYF